jgi:prepilin-type processing-associated H-X9-DG protein
MHGNYIFCDGHADRATPADFYANCTNSAGTIPAHVAANIDWWNWFKS